MQSYIAPFKEYIKAQASHMAFGSRFYTWSLDTKIEPQMQVEISDCWGGDSGKGLWLQQGKIGTQGVFWQPGLDFWDHEEASADWLDVVHGFDWLRDLKALGGHQARQTARAYILDWIKNYDAWHAKTWTMGRLGVRIASWISFYSFFGASADDAFQYKFFKSLNRQTRHLSRILPDKMSQGIYSLRAVKALIYAGLFMPDSRSLYDQGLELLIKHLPEHILSDGGYVSRSPEDLLEAVQILLDLKTVLLQNNLGSPEIQFALDRAIPALKFFRHGDGRLAVFNGGQLGKTATLDLVFKRAGNRSKICSSLPETGYQRLTQGKTTLLMDTGTCPAAPMDMRAHVAPLAFEMSYGKDRIFTNCGTNPLDPDWQSMLRATAAHNTLILDDRNACEVKDSGHIGRRHNTPEIERQDEKKSVLLQASHDGYKALNGFSHKRRLYLCDHGRDLRGEDIIIRDIDTGVICKTVTIRFHLHPRVNISLLSSGSEALLKCPSGTGWRFTVKGAKMTLEDSLFIGEGVTPRKTKQIVLQTPIFHDQNFVKWALQAE